MKFLFIKGILKLKGNEFTWFWFNKVKAEGTDFPNTLPFSVIWTSISTEGIDAEHMAVLEYYFEQNYEERNSFYSFYTFDDSYSEVETEAGKADIAELGVRFKDEGFLIYDSDGINAVLNERAQEIGYPGKI